MQSQSPESKKDMIILDHVQKRAMKIIKGLEYLLWEKLREHGLFSLEKGRHGDFLNMV